MIYTATARAEVAEIFARIAQDNPIAAAAVASAIQAAAKRLGAFPRLGAETEMAVSTSRLPTRM